MPALLTLCSAALYGLAFATPALGVLGWVALVPFFAALGRVGPARAAGLGLLMALAGALSVTWWFPPMVHAYFGVRPIAAWAAWLAFCTATVAGPLVPFAAWTSWLARRRAASPLIVACGWTAYELLRARLWVGNPWALLGYASMSSLPMVQIADVTGPYGPSLVMAAVNAILAAFVTPALRGRRFATSSIVVAVLVAATLGYGASRLATSFDGGPPVRVALLQPAIAAAERRSVEARTRALAWQLEETRDAVGRGARLVVWPENAIDFYLDEPSAERDAVMTALRALDADVVLGGPSFALGERAVRYRNSVYAVEQGLVAGRYDKVHLLPFAESDFTPGTHAYALRTRAGLVATFVCFEAMYPELVRRLASGGVALLANVSNDAWFASDAAARMHLDMARLRAVEQRRWLVRATTTGISAIVDPQGRVVAASALDVPAVVEGDVRPSGGVTWYQRNGDVVAWCAVVIVLGATILAYLRDQPPHAGGS
jgi:apolipoprotein N-acyltransferase